MSQSLMLLQLLRAEALPPTLQQRGCEAMYGTSKDEQPNKFVFFEVFSSEDTNKFHIEQPYTKKLFAIPGWKARIALRAYLAQSAIRASFAGLRRRRTPQSPHGSDNVWVGGAKSLLRKERKKESPMRPRLFIDLVLITQAPQVHRLFLRIDSEGIFPAVLPIRPLSARHTPSVPSCFPEQEAIQRDWEEMRNGRQNPVVLCSIGFQQRPSYAFCRSRKNPQPE